MKVATALADYLSVKCMLCCGGKDKAGQCANSGQGSHIVVGTPGRILGIKNTHFTLFMRLIIYENRNSV